MLSDHQKCRALSVAVETRGTNTYPKVAACASLFVPSAIDAKSKPGRNAKYPRNAQLCQAFSPKITHSIPRRPKNISEQNYPKVVAHEMGHMIDDLAGKFVHFDKTGPIRDVVNSDPRLSKIIQFNAIPGLAVAGAAYKFIPVERDPFADEQTK